MDKAIWKYPLSILDEQCTPVPMGAKFLSIIAQNERPTVYFIVDPWEKSQNPVVFYVMGTGRPFPGDYLSHATFLGTVPLLDGRLIYHVWADMSRI